MLDCIRSLPLFVVGFRSQDFWLVTEPEVRLQIGHIRTKAQVPPLCERFKRIWRDPDAAPRDPDNLQISTASSDFEISA